MSLSCLSSHLRQWYCTGIGSVPAAGHIIDDFFLTVYNMNYDMHRTFIMIKTHLPFTLLVIWFTSSTDSKS